MDTREEHLAWCKRRALALVDEGEVGYAVASMLSDLRKWEGGALYQPHTLLVLTQASQLLRTPADVREWIEGFN